MKKTLLATITIGLAAAGLQAQVLINTQTNIAPDLGTTGSDSVGFTVNAGSNRGLVVAIGIEGGNPATFSGATWTVGANPVQNFSMATITETFTGTAVFYLPDPIVGTGTITVNSSGSFGGTSGGTVYSLTNVDTFSPQTAAGDIAETASLDFGTLPAGSLIVASATNDDATPSFSLQPGSTSTSFNTEQLAATSTNNYITTAEGVDGDAILDGTFNGRYAFAGVAVTAIPEPSTALLLSLGLGSMLMLRRRRA